MHPYIVMSLDSYVPLIERLKKYIKAWEDHYCENTHLLRHRSKHACASAIYYGLDLASKPLC